MCACNQVRPSPQRAEKMGVIRLIISLSTQRPSLPHPRKHTAHCSWLSVKRPLSMLRSCYCPCFDTRGRKLHCNALKTGDLRPSTNTHTEPHTQSHTKRQAECDTMRGKLNHSVETGGDSGISRDFFSLFWERCLWKTQTIKCLDPCTHLQPDRPHH